MALPGWRNWQTRRTQNPVLSREWEFDPPSGHHYGLLGSIEIEKKWEKQCKPLSEISGMLIHDGKPRIDLTGATALTIVGALDHEIKSYI